MPIGGIICLIMCLPVMKNPGTMANNDSVPTVWGGAINLYKRTIDIVIEDSVVDRVSNPLLQPVVDVLDVVAGIKCGL